MFLIGRVGMTQNNVGNTISVAEDAAEAIFGTYSDLDYAYYLWGEWGETGSAADDLHEGVDLQRENSSGYAGYYAVYCTTPGGTITKSDSVGVNVYDPILEVTISYQHLSNRQYSVGDTVNIGDTLGYQNTTDGHVHCQVCSHEECDIVHASQNDMTLTCDNPYATLFIHLFW